VKGASEVLLECCSRIQTSTGLKAIDQEKLRDIKSKVIENFAS